MSLSIEPKKGVRLKLADYSVIKTWQGGGRFWEHDFQLTIRQGTLQEFLPRATDEGDSVFYEHFVDGIEGASASTQASSLEQVPGAQIERLRAALAELKAKADDAHCDSNKKRMIEAFRLPDPQKDAELYRLYGSGSKRRLIVLWGLEKEVGSALAPLKALDRVPQKSDRAGGGKTRLCLLVLLLLLIGTWFVFHKSREITPDGRIADTNGTPGVRELTHTTTPGGKDPNPMAESLGQEGRPLPLAGTPKSGGTPMPAAGTPEPRGTPMPVAGMPDPGGTAMPAAGTPEPGGTPTRAAGTPEPGGTPTRAAGTPEPGGTPVSAAGTPKPGGTPVPAAGTPKPGGTPMRTAGTPEPRGTPVQVTTEPASSLEIINARSSSTPKDGYVEVLLNARNRDGSGALDEAPTITEWRVDGKVQRGKNGKPLTGSSLPTQLTKGSHLVMVTGVGKNGRPIRSEAEIEVGVKVTEESNVKVRSVEH
jgi:hypothetical protein